MREPIQSIGSWHRFLLGLPVALVVLVIVLAVTLGDQFARLGVGRLEGLALACAAGAVFVGLPYAVFVIGFLQWSVRKSAAAMERMLNGAPLIVLALWGV